MREERRNRSATEKHIRETFLHMLESTPFDKIRITGLCEAAGINRSTFYAHFYDVYDLLDKTIEAAFECVNEDRPKDYEITVEHLWELANLEDLDEFISHESELPLWHRFIDYGTYLPLVKDPFICQRMVQLIYQEKRHVFIEVTIGGSLSVKELENLFWFILNGSMAINQKKGWVKDRSWFSLQRNLIKFVIAGCDAVSSRSPSLKGSTTNP